MRVLFLSTWYPHPRDNGSKIRVYYLLRALGERHAVTLVTFAFGTARPEEGEALQACCAEVQVVRRSPFDAHRLPPGLQFLSPTPVSDWPVPEMSRQVQHCLARTRFDVVISSTEVMSTYALLAPAGTAKVLEEHNSMTRWSWDRYRATLPRVQRLRRWVSWWKCRGYERALLPKFDLCTMVSRQDQATCRQLLGSGRGRVEVVPNGVDCEQNQPGLAAVQANRLVFNGALTYRANYDAMCYFLREVYPLIRRQVPDVSLTITGAHAGVALDQLPLDDSVHLTGFVEDIRPQVASAAACLAPLRDGGGTRLKILEAMALGTPVVATSKGAEGLEAMADQEFLLADTPEAFAAATVRLLHDPALRQRLALNARRWVEQGHDWSALGRRFTALVEEAAASAASGERRE